MSTCRGTAFSTPPVICELLLLYSERYRPTGILIHRKIRMRLAAGYASVDKAENLPVLVRRMKATRNPGGHPLDYVSIRVGSVRGKY
jgi:hypothetical protein